MVVAVVVVVVAVVVAVVVNGHGWGSTVQRVQQTEMNHNHVSQINHMIMVDFCLSSLSLQVCGSPT